MSTWDQFLADLWRHIWGWCEAQHTLKTMTPMGYAQLTEEPKKHICFTFLEKRYFKEQKNSSKGIDSNIFSVET